MDFDPLSSIQIQVAALFFGLDVSQGSGRGPRLR
ncbi:hypothetical protein BJY21_002244 [Kineosphaera limosa]|nr:hypothetical protein [Kineosphaera limosa]